MALLVSMTLFAERVSVEDAAVVANNFMNVASAPGVKKATPAKRMVHKAVAEENLYYIYQNADGEGWVIVAADDAVTPILAYSETGTFRTDNMPVNIRKWMGKYNNFIKKIEDDGVVATEETQAEWKALRKGARKATAAAVVGPLIKTTWDQDAPYYDLCPGTGYNKAYTGCVATAMAQVMKYWEWPVKGTGSHSYKPLDVNNPQDKYGNYNYSSRYKNTLSADFGNTTYDWSNMKNSYTTGSYTTAEGTAVATLMYHCGVATEMMYGNDADGGSGTYTVNYLDETWGTTVANTGGCAENAFWYYFGYKKEGLVGYMRDGLTDNNGNLYTDDNGNPYYKKWSDSEWTAMIKEELDKKHPIMYGGAGDKGGHSFICDGYDTNGKFHFNWGWSGSNDGYYTLSNLAPGSGGAGGGSYDFSEEQDVLIGIVPDKPLVDPFQITWMSNGAQFTTTTSTGTVVLPTTEPTACEGKVFVGWTATANYSNATTAPTFVKAGDAVEEGAVFYAVFATQKSTGTAQIVDELTGATTGITGNQYASWSGKTVTSSAVYAGQSASSYNSIQLRSNNNNSGVVTTASGGKITKVSVVWNTNTAADRKLDVYGKNSAYTDPSDLYDASAKGTKLGTIQKGVSTELSVEGDYTFVGVRSNSGALYLDQLTFTWNGSSTTYSNYTTTCGGGTDVEQTIVAPKATKIIENGQVIIIRDNEKYSIFGQKIK